MQIIIDLYDYTGKYIGTLVATTPDPLFKLFLFLIALSSLPIVIPLIALVVGITKLFQGKIFEALVSLSIPALAVGWLIFYNTWGHNYFVTSDSIQRNYNEINNQISQGEQLISFRITEGQCNLPNGCKWGNNGLPYLIIEAQSNWKFNAVVRSVKYPNGEAILYCEYDQNQTFEPLGTLVINCSPYELNANIEPISYEEICLEVEFVLTPPNSFRQDGDRVITMICGVGDNPKRLAIATSTPTFDEWVTALTQGFEENPPKITVEWDVCKLEGPLDKCQGMENGLPIIFVRATNEWTEPIVVGFLQFSNKDNSTPGFVNCMPYGGIIINPNKSDQFYCVPKSLVVSNQLKDIPDIVCVTISWLPEPGILLNERVETDICRDIPPN